MKNLLPLLYLIMIISCSSTNIKDDKFTRASVTNPTALQLLPLPKAEIHIAKDAEFFSRFDASYFMVFDILLRQHFSERNIQLQTQPTRFVLEVKRILVSEKTATDSPVDSKGDTGTGAVKANNLEMRIACIIKDTQTGNKEEFEGGYVNKTYADKDMLTGIFTVERNDKIDGESAMANTLNYLRGSCVKFINKQQKRLPD